MVRESVLDKPCLKDQKYAVSFRISERISLNTQCSESVLNYMDKLENSALLCVNISYGIFTSKRKTEGKSEIRREKNALCEKRMHYLPLKLCTIQMMSATLLR